MNLKSRDPHSDQEKCGNPRKEAGHFKGPDEKYDIPTAAYENFDRRKPGLSGTARISDRSEGRWSGTWKGVLICNTLEEAKAGVKEIMDKIRYPVIPMVMGEFGDRT